MRIILHILKRLALVALGYLLGLLAALVATVVLFATLSSFPGAPDYFAAFEWSPLVIIAAPFVAPFVYWIALLLTVMQTLVLAGVSELLRWRNAPLHMLFGGLVGTSGFAVASPTILDGISPTDWADLAIIGAAGTIGGLIYWLIAGRGAGFMPRDA